MRETKIPGTVKKKVSKTAIQVWTSVPFKGLPLWLDAAIPAPLSLLQTLSKISNENAVKGRQWLLLNLCNVTILFLALWLKTKWWLCPTPDSHPPPPHSLFATFFVPRDESGCEREAFCWRSRGSKRITDGRPLTAFLLKILDSVSSSGGGSGITAFSHWWSTLKGTKVSNLYGYCE